MGCRTESLLRLGLPVLRARIVLAIRRLPVLRGGVLLTVRGLRVSVRGAGAVRLSTGLGLRVPR